MFVHHCTACERRQLIFPSQVTGVSKTDAGTVMTLTCWCGAEQTMRADLLHAEPVAA